MGVRVTGAGRRFLKDLRVVLSRLDAAVRAAGDAGSATEGAVSIGIVGSLASSFLGRLLRSYMDQHPAVALTILEASYAEHVAAVVDRTLDIAFVIGAPQPADCDFEALWSETIYAALSADDLRSKQDTLSLYSLAAEHFIVTSDAAGFEVLNLIIRRLSVPSFNPLISEYRVGRETLMAMVSLGFGTSLVCGSEASVGYPGVHFARLEGEAVSFSAVWAPGNDNPALRRLLSVARVQSQREKQEGDAPWRTPGPPP